MVTFSPDVVLKRYSPTRIGLFNRRNLETIYLNEDGMAVINECLGEKSIEKICNMLAKQYKWTEVSRDRLEDFLQNLINRKFLVEKRKEVLDQFTIRENTTDPYLDTLFMEITRACNLKCKHCYVNGGVTIENELSTDEVIDIIKQAVNMGMVHLFITGGEPLVRPDIFDILRVATEQLKLGVTIFSNATLINRSVARKLKAIGVGKVHTSLDGPSARTHDSFRGVPGSFKRTISGIKNMVEVKLPVRVGVTVSKMNIHEVDEILFLLEELNVEYGLGSIMLSGRALTNPSLCVKDEEFVGIIKRMLSRSKQRLSFLKGEFLTTSPVCGAGKSMCFLSADGIVSVCPTLSHRENYDFIAGNIRESMLDKIWREGKSLVAYRKTGCSEWEKCSYKEFCGGGCRSRAFLHYGGLDKPDYVFCRIFEECS